MERLNFDEAAATVTKALKAIKSKSVTGEKHAKVYFAGPSSYSWDELIAEVEDKTTFGMSYVGTLVTAAADQNLGLNDYLRDALRR